MKKNLYMENVGKKAKIAAFDLSNTNIKKKNDVLKLFKIYLKNNSKLIIKENKKDLLIAKKKD